MEISKCIKERRTIRKFENRELEQEIIHKLIESAIYAPSACNMQAWKFLIIQSGIKIEEMIRYGAAKWIRNVPTGILVIYRNDISVNSKLYKDHYQSAAAAIENILLEAANLGLATCWICDLPRPKYIRKIFNIPKQFDIIAYIAIGYPQIDNSQLSLNHYDNKENFKLHARKYSLNQVISYDSFTASDKDCTLIPPKKKLLVKRFLLKRKLPFGFLFTDHMLKEK
jgi:nitroreductase